jgi:hypothetical protein
MSKFKKIGCFALLATVIITSWNTGLLDERANNAQIAEFRQRFQQIEPEMTREQVKKILGETRYRAREEWGRPMSKIRIWAYTKYSSYEEPQSTPAVYFSSDKDSDRVIETEVDASKLHIRDISCAFLWILC